MSEPSYTRGLAVGAVLGLAVAAAVWAWRWKPGEVPPAPTYAQQGEDIIVKDLFVKLFDVEHPTYIDIGAHQPIIGNNTYLFYTTGSTGVLVEPNPDLTDLLKTTRPKDTVLDVGIGAGGADTEADYYVMVQGRGGRNTFSKEEADKRPIKQVIKRKLVDLNGVLAKYFPPGGPDFMSIDTEGYDLTILKSLDFTRFRPRIICTETLDDDKDMVHGILELMASKNYDIRGGTWVNTIFVDREALTKKWHWQQPDASTTGN
jgi:FkbM family methyltransferase